MIEIELENKIFRDMLEAIYAIRDEAALNFTDGAIYSRVTDYGNVVLVEATIPNDLFSGLSSDENREVGLNIEDLLIYTRLGPSADDIKIMIGDKFRMKTGNYEIEMDIFETSYLKSKAKIPDEFECKCNVNINEIRKIARAASQIQNDVLVFELNNTHELLTISSEGDNETIRVDIPVKDKSNVDVFNELKSGYSVDYMLKIINALYNIGIYEVSVAFKDDFPIKMSCPLHEQGSLTYYIAPRIID